MSSTWLGRVLQKQRLRSAAGESYIRKKRRWPASVAGHRAFDVHLQSGPVATARADPWHSTSKWARLGSRRMVSQRVRFRFAKPMVGVATSLGVFSGRAVRSEI